MKKLYANEFNRAFHFLIPLYRGELTWTKADYQAFVYQTEGVRLIFYPHKTSAGNQHIRVRDGGSKNKVRAQAILDVIQLDLATDCTFSQKNNHCQFHYTDEQKKRVRMIAQRESL